MMEDDSKPSKEAGDVSKPKARRGRRTKGADHVDKLKASKEAIERLRVILETLTGKLTIEEAAAKLGVKESRFHVIRDKALQAAAEALERQKPGPKKTEQPEDEEATRIKALEAEVDRLQLELLGANVRTGLAMTDPHLLIDKKIKPGEKKISAESRKGKRRRLRPKRH